MLPSIVRRVRHKVHDAGAALHEKSGHDCAEIRENGQVTFNPPGGLPGKEDVMSKEFISFAASTKLHARPDANLLLTKPLKTLYDVEVIKFSTRKALEAFNKKANLNAVIKTQVPLNCAIYKHESDSEARSEQINPYAGRASRLQRCY